MENQTQFNSNKSFTHENFGDSKLSKSKELNPSMSIQEKSPDEYENKINNLGSSQGVTNNG